jgi:hypothetical protein
MRSTIASPAASSAAELIFTPVESRCIDCATARSFLARLLAAIVAVMLVPIFKSFNPIAQKYFSEMRTYFRDLAKRDRQGK